MMPDAIIKVFAPALASFAIGIALTPFLTHYLYKWKAWKKKSGRTDFQGNEATIFNQIHKDKAVGTPRMGGIVIWGSVAITTLSISAIAMFTESPAFEKIEFLSRHQTWIPFFTLIAGAIVGLCDDYLEIRPTMDRFSSGLSLSIRLALVSLLSLFVGWWFYDKLDVQSISIPFGSELTIGWLIIPLFVFVTIVVYAGGVIDGIDGLAGGVFTAIFAAYASVAFNQGLYDLAALCAAIAGALLAFLWFNIPPARFYMTETGSMALTLTLVVVAFMTDTLGEGKGLSALAIIALPLLVTAASSLIQVLSKKYFGKKVFRVAPLHHHFEALGWPPQKVVMRYWVISLVCAVLGMTFAAIA